MAAIVDTIEGEIAAKAGIGPGMKVVAVNGRRFSAEVLRDALKPRRPAQPPSSCWSKTPTTTRPTNIDYHGGEKYPHLVRDESKPDLLTEILKAK